MCPTIVRAIQELKALLPAYSDRKETANLDDFLAHAAPGIDPAHRVALTLALLTGGQVAAEAGTCLLHEADSREYLAIAGRPPQRSTDHIDS